VGANGEPIFGWPSNSNKRVYHVFHPAHRSIPFNSENGTHLGVDNADGGKKMKRKAAGR
jgi:hypothetical protein